MATITLRKNKDGTQTYYFRASVGYSTSGEQIRKSSSWVVPSDMTPSKAKRIAMQKAMEFETKALNEEVSERIKFEDFSKRWMKSYAEKQLRKGTIEADKKILARINKELGHLYMDKIRPTTILAFYETLGEPFKVKKYQHKNDFLDTIRRKRISVERASKICGVSPDTIKRIGYGRIIGEDTAKRICKALDIDISKEFKLIVEEKTFSDKTIRNYHALLRKILATAVVWQVIPSNPCERVQPPKVRRKESYCMSESEVDTMLCNLPREILPVQAFIYLALDTGARRGELLGLTWDDVDFAKHLIDINKSLLYLASEGVFTDDTKNEYSKRIVKISETSMRFLSMLHNEQIKQAEKLGTAWVNSNHVFVDELGNPMRPDFITRRFKRFVKDCGLSDKIHLHTLRHTSASLLVYGGINLKAVSSRLGHASTQTTAMIYEHQIRTYDEQSAEVLERVLRKPRIVNPENKFRIV